MQRLLQPEDVERRHRLGEPDAPRHVVRRVHVQHQHHAGPDRGAHGTDPRHLVRQRQRPRLQLHRAIAIRDEPAELLRARLRRFAFAVVAARRIGEHLGARAAEQPEHRQPDRLALQVPQRDVDAADGRHGLRPLDARQRRRHAVPAANAARPRRGQREQQLPDLDVSQRIHPRDHRGETSAPGRRSASAVHRRSRHSPPAPGRCAPRPARPGRAPSAHAPSSAAGHRAPTTGARGPR